MRISKHLSLAEVIRSESAKRKGISNMPTEDHIENLKILAKNIFEKIRENFKVPIHVSSGYRSHDLNVAVKGSKKSQHSRGEAIDIDMDGSTSKVTNKDIFNFIKENLDFDQLIWEFGNEINPDWVHVSYSKSKNRKQILKAIKKNGKTSYIDIT